MPSDSTKLMTRIARGHTTNLQSLLHTSAQLADEHRRRRARTQPDRHSVLNELNCTFCDQQLRLVLRHPRPLKCLSLALLEFLVTPIAFGRHAIFVRGLTRRIERYPFPQLRLVLFTQHLAFAAQTRLLLARLKE